MEPVNTNNITNFPQAIAGVKVSANERNDPFTTQDDVAVSRDVQQVSGIQTVTTTKTDNTQLAARTVDIKDGPHNISIDDAQTKLLERCMAFVEEKTLQADKSYDIQKYFDLNVQSILNGMQNKRYITEEEALRFKKLLKNPTELLEEFKSQFFDKSTFLQKPSDNYAERRIDHNMTLMLKNKGGEAKKFIESKIKTIKTAQDAGDDAILEFLHDEFIHEHTAAGLGSKYIAQYRKSEGPFCISEEFIKMISGKASTKKEKEAKIQRFKDMSDIFYGSNLDIKAQADFWLKKYTGLQELLDKQKFTSDAVSHIKQGINSQLVREHLVMALLALKELTSDQKIKCKSDMSIILKKTYISRASYFTVKHDANNINTMREISFTLSPAGAITTDVDANSWLCTFLHELGHMIDYAFVAKDIFTESKKCFVDFEGKNDKKNFAIEFLMNFPAIKQNSSDVNSLLFLRSMEEGNPDKRQPMEILYSDVVWSSDLESAQIIGVRMIGDTLIYRSTNDFALLCDLKENSATYRTSDKFKIVMRNEHRFIKPYDLEFAAFLANPDYYNDEDFMQLIKDLLEEIKKGLNLENFKKCKEKIETYKNNCYEEDIDEESDINTTNREVIHALALMLNTKLEYYSRCKGVPTEQSLDVYCKISNIGKEIISNAITNYNSSMMLPEEITLNQILFFQFTLLSGQSYKNKDDGGTEEISEGTPAI